MAGRQIYELICGLLLLGIGVYDILNKRVEYPGPLWTRVIFGFLFADGKMLPRWLAVLFYLIAGTYLVFASSHQ